MSSVLNSGAEAFTARALFGGALPESTSRNVLNEFAEFAHGSFNHGGYRDVTEREPGLGGRNYAILGTVIFGLHLAAFWAYINTPSTPYVQPTKHEVLIEFAKPVAPPPPPPVIEPPKPPPPPPPKAQRTPPPPQPQALRTPPADAVIAADDIVVQENTTAPVSTGPVVADAAPTPPAPPAPAPPKEEPITEAFGGAGYLNNPNPEYPPAAERQGLTGKVLLRVRVLPDGSVGGVEVKKSSGHKILDNAAIKAVQGWKFSPSKRGNTPIEGSVNVPIDFQL